MPTYDEISNDWFYLLLPTGQTFEELEAGEDFDDREKTKAILRQMERELPRTFKDVLRIEHFEYSTKVLKRIDEALTPEMIASWIRDSDPDDSNNDFKLTLSELAVYFGSLLAREHRGEWHYARFPNFFESSVVIGDVAFHVFDSLMKRCSDDRCAETLVSKWETFQRVIASSRMASVGTAAGDTRRTS